MRRSTRQYKADLEELVDGYQEAKMEDFQVELMDELRGMEVDEIDIDFFQGFLDSFTFPSEEQWAIDEYESRRDSFEDAKYEAMKDERMGL